MSTATKIGSDAGALPAGGELNALVAVQVMGWRWVRILDAPGKRSWHLAQPDDAERFSEARTEVPEGERYPYWERVPPPYSTDWNAAALVVERMRKQGWEVRIESDGPRWMCRLLRGGRGGWITEGETVPLSICRAALLATRASK